MPGVQPPPPQASPEGQVGCHGHPQQPVAAQVGDGTRLLPPSAAQQPLQRGVQAVAGQRQSEDGQQGGGEGDGVGGICTEV